MDLLVLQLPAVERAEVERTEAAMETRTLKESAAATSRSLRADARALAASACPCSTRG